MWGAWVVVRHSPSRGGRTVGTSRCHSTIMPPFLVSPGVSQWAGNGAGVPPVCTESERRARSVVWGGLASDNSDACIFTSLGRADTLCRESDASVQGFPGGASGKESACNAVDTRVAGLISGLGRSPGVGNGNVLQCSCLENPMDRGAWRTIAHGVAQS